MNSVGGLVWTLGDEDQYHWVGFEEWGTRVVRRPCLEVEFFWLEIGFKIGRSTGRCGRRFLTPINVFGF